MSVRVVFMGTPGSALPTLDALTERHEVGLVLTQPDRPKGRSGTPTPPPVKARATALGIAVAQPERRSEISQALLRHQPFDVGVVVAYGRIVPGDALSIPRKGMLNVHFSLLPRWRGAAPVARAIMAGDPMTGVTIMQMDEGLDTGPVLTAQAVDIDPHEDAGDLTSRLSRLGAHLLVGALDPYLAGELEAVPQSGEGMTRADKLTGEDRPIDLSATVEETVNRVRALAPEPGATLGIDGETHKVLAVRASETSPSPGTWTLAEGVPVIGLSDGGVELVTLQPPGKVPLDGAAWARGRRRTGGVVK